MNCHIFCHKKWSWKFRRDFVELSLKFRCNMIWHTKFEGNFNDTSTIFFVAKLCGKTFCHIPKLRNYLGFNEILGLWQFVLPQNFATKMIVEISLNFRSKIVCQIMLQRNFNESSTNFHEGFLWQNCVAKCVATNIPRISNEFPTNFLRRIFDTPNEGLTLYWAPAKHAESHSKVYP